MYDRTTLSSSHVDVVTRGLYGIYVLKTLHFWRRGTRSNDHGLVDRRKSKSARKMPTFGKSDEYRETKDWRYYIERVNHFFEAKEIADPDKKRSIFLISVKAKTYKLIRSFVAPEDPKDKSFEALAQLAQDH